jgi:hypothetical protein
MTAIWVWIGVIVGTASLAESLYAGFEEHSWSNAFPFLLMAAFAFGLAVGTFLLRGPRSRV